MIDLVTSMTTNNVDGSFLKNNGTSFHQMLSSAAQISSKSDRFNSYDTETERFLHAANPAFVRQITNNNNSNVSTDMMNIDGNRSSMQRNQIYESNIIDNMEPLSIIRAPNVAVSLLNNANAYIDINDGSGLLYRKSLAQINSIYTHNQSAMDTEWLSINRNSIATLGGVGGNNNNNNDDDGGGSSAQINELLSNYGGSGSQTERSSVIHSTNASTASNDNGNSIQMNQYYNSSSRFGRQMKNNSTPIVTPTTSSDCGSSDVHRIKGLLCENKPTQVNNKSFTIRRLLAVDDDDDSDRSSYHGFLNHF